MIWLACTAEPEAPAPSPAPSEVAQPLIPEQLEAAVADALAPSPQETRLAVERAGISLTFATLLPERNFKFENQDPDRVALRTGVLLSDLVLAVKEAEKPWLVGELQKLHDGLKAMGSGEGLLSTVLDMKTGVENDALSRDELLQQLDDIVGMSRGQGVAPGAEGEILLEAGAWLAGTNMTARAILRSGQLDAADSLLRQKQVAQHFLDYTNSDEAQEKAPEVTVLLRTTLERLVALADQETIGRQDLEEVRDQTQALVDLL